MGVLKGLITNKRTAAPAKRSIKIPVVSVGEGNAAKALNDLLPVLREMAQRIESAEQIAVSGGFSPIVVPPLEADKDGIVAGRLVHVREDGVAELAVNTNALKYCTHVVAGVLPNGGLSCFGLGHWPVACLVFGNVGIELPLWLSDIPGHATDVKPTAEGQDSQLIGYKQSTRDDQSGICFAVFKPEVPGTFDLADIVGGWGTAGQHLATNGSEDGAEWVDPFSGLTLTDGTETLNDIYYVDFTGATVSAGAGSGEAGVTVNGYIDTTAAEEGIEAGMLLHVDSLGYSWKANGAILIRYATHVATEVASSKVTATNIPTNIDMLVASDSPFDYTNTLYLSATTPGHATTDPPDASDGSKVIQKVGIMIGERDSGTGKAQVTVGIEQGVFG